MQLFIQVVNGEPFEHPMALENLQQLIPGFDPENPPEGFVRFERVECPRVATPFEREISSYKLVDGVFKDVWEVVPLTEEEKAAKKQELTDRIFAIIEMRKKFAEDMIANGPEDNKANWQGYLQKLNDWVLVDVLDPQIPIAKENGAPMVLLNTDEPGSAPNVIG